MSACRDAGASQVKTMGETTTNLYAGVDAQLVHYRVDVVNAAILRRAAYKIPL